jgi:hypothetical protein
LEKVVKIGPIFAKRFKTQIKKTRDKKIRETRSNGFKIKIPELMLRNLNFKKSQINVRK